MPAARILVVDDERLVLKAMARALDGAHDLTLLSSAEEALARVAGGERFDLLLLDLSMPGMSGMDLHARLAEIAPDQARRAVFLTGGAFTERARRFLASTPNRCLVKPFDARQLGALLAEAANLDTSGRSG